MIKYKLFLFAGLVLLQAFFNSPKANPWPLTIAKDGRYLLDKNKRPYWLCGDAAWSLLVQPTLAEAKSYIQYRASQGINALLVNVLERRYSDKAPNTTEGNIAPFTAIDDITRPNEKYFQRLDSLLTIAEKSGITVLLFPAYLGYLNEGDGWKNVFAGSSVDACRVYATFIAGRYANRPNIIWVMGGDHNPDQNLDKLNLIAETIISQNPNAVITAHCHPGVHTRAIYNDPQWMNLSTVYNYGYLHEELLNAYKEDPVKPFIMIESTYEGEWDSTPIEIRNQQWQSVCNGATGAFMGNNPIWKMAGGWKNQWNSSGSQALSVVKRILDTIPWFTFVPDYEKKVLISGWNGFRTTNRAAFAVGPHGALGYFPDKRQIELDLKWNAFAKWIDPSDGKTILVQKLKKGKQKLVMPVNNADALLLLNRN